MGKGDDKTFQGEEGEGDCFPEPGGLGSWERSQTNEHWGEECLPSLSSGASAPGSSAGLRLGLERLPLGLEGREAFPTGLQAQRPVSVGASSSPSPLGVGGVCEGMARLPLPGQLLQNLPAPTFHPFLKGKSLLPNSAGPEPHSWVEEKTRPGREDEHQETLPGPPTQALRPFPQPPSGGKRPQSRDEFSTWASVNSSLGVRRSAPLTSRTPHKERGNS